MRFAKNIAVTVLWVVAATTQLTFAQTENPSLHGQQVQLPNDVEQKASYCLAVKKLQYSEFVAVGIGSDPDLKGVTNPDTRRILEKSALRGKKALEQVQDNINRLRSFLLPRMPYLETTSLFSAYSRGKADVSRNKKIFEVKRKECDARCKNTEGSQQEVSCRKECFEEEELVRRLSQCNDLSFLPY